MDQPRRNFGIDRGQADDPVGRSDIVDEFADPMRIEELAERWHCTVKTAKAKVVANGLGIRPGGTWLISRRRIREFEESLRVGSAAISTAPAGTKANECRNRTKSELMKLGILRSRVCTPDIRMSTSRSLRKTS